MQRTEDALQLIEDATRLEPGQAVRVRLRGKEERGSVLAHNKSLDPENRRYRVALGSGFNTRIATVTARDIVEVIHNAPAD